LECFGALSAAQKRRIEKKNNSLSDSVQTAHVCVRCVARIALRKEEPPGLTRRERFGSLPAFREKAATPTCR
jgi:hypothetical protein